MVAEGHEDDNDHDDDGDSDDEVLRGNTEHLVRNALVLHGPTRHLIDRIRLTSRSEIA
jgi:hypothetical protein